MPFDLLPENTLSQPGAMPMRVFSISESGFSVRNGELDATARCLPRFVLAENSAATIFGKI